jgi:hypothetical protein
MSAPMVTGLCALMLQVDSKYTPGQVKRFITSTATNPDDIPPSIIGYGRINASMSK